MKNTLAFLLLMFLPFLAESSELYEPIKTFQADRSALSRKYSNALSEEYFERFGRLYEDWLTTVQDMDYGALSEDGKIDYLAFKNYLEKAVFFHDKAFSEYKEVADVKDFADELEAFYIFRRSAQKPDAKAIAAQFTDAKKNLQGKIEQLPSTTPYSSWQKAELAADVIGSLQETLEEAYLFYNDYDPAFTWWVKKPWEELSALLESYEKALKAHYENFIVKDDGSGIIGKPIGAEAIKKELEFELIPYTAQELIDEAERQFAYCEKEMLKASQELGYGNDWKAALEHVKNSYAPPGEWPGDVYDLAVEATEYVEKHDLITIPELAKETWRTKMMSPEAQRVNPFFLGGEAIIISYPTSTMTQEEKLMSMRGNNPHFSRATVQHEIIPGHHLQGFMNQRHKPYRRMFYTPFWIEGWALYWELNLWDKSFPRNASDKVGMLFWRMHRCARIIFSLNYHLGNMTPQECIDFLVDKVGHEYANAEAEVRRSFEGNYGPLYQIAYMVGGLQFYALKAEMVDQGTMSEKEFHDFIMTQNTLPIELIRARIKGETLSKDHRTSWRFLD
ncbi:DUF885 family protein [Echinicola vietnamensis]|uniref:X-Pro dipeptidyl-peptidase n=1 Tax=Echinicola vietnamensis (strain DSM 17526 / LMG 23754 / KMM 6221) TaxID=926556 RepID=L0G0N5_ECHVK|nr:DUF885 family protein [Echinicola vietnamensis]AGA79759.1 hypothetical protein Echvi_3543 [Echinicola vietnamensis DSM 17526]